MHADYWTDGLAHLIAHTFCAFLHLSLQTPYTSVSLSLLYITHMQTFANLHISAFACF